MRFRMPGAAALQACVLALMLALLGQSHARAADNYPARAGDGTMYNFASKFIGGVQYPEHLLMGLFGLTPTPLSVDAAGNVNVNVISGGGGGTSGGTAKAASPTYSEGATGQALSLDLTGYLRTRAKQDGTWSVGLTGTLPAFASTPTVNLGTIGTAATAANQTAVQAAAGSDASQVLGVQGVAGMKPVLVGQPDLPSPLPVKPPPVPNYIPFQNGDVTNAVLASGTFDDGGYLSFIISALGTGSGVGVSFQESLDGSLWSTGFIQTSAGCFSTTSTLNSLASVPSSGAKYWRALSFGTITSGATTGQVQVSANGVSGGLGFGSCPQQNQPTLVTTGLASNGVYLNGSSGNVANATATATMAAATGKTNYVQGVMVMALGATAGSTINCTLTGPTNTLTVPIAIPAGVSTPVTFTQTFPQSGLPMNATNVAATWSCPAAGSGNVQFQSYLWGYRQ